MEQENKVIFDDEKKEEPNKIDEEVTSIIKAADNLINVLEKIAPSINDGKVVNEEAFMKVIKPLCVNVENTLPQLLECVDNLEYRKSGSYGMWNHPRGHVWNVFVRPASS